MTHSPELQRWNQRFDTEEYLFGTEPNAFLVSQRARLRSGMQALCIADGEGRNGVWLARQGLHVTAFDFSPVAAGKAGRLAERAGVAVDYRVETVQTWLWESAAFDLVAAIFIQFATPPERTRLFEGILRTLRPGGLLLLQGYRREQIEYGTGGPPHVENMYTEPMLRDSFQTLEILHLAAHDDVIVEGSGHSGRSALIDLVARKPAP